MSYAWLADAENPERNVARLAGRRSEPGSMTTTSRVSRLLELVVQLQILRRHLDGVTVGCL